MVSVREVDVTQLRISNDISWSNVHCKCLSHSFSDKLYIFFLGRIPWTLTRSTWIPTTKYCSTISYISTSTKVVLRYWFWQRWIELICHTMRPSADKKFLVSGRLLLQLYLYVLSWILSSVKWECYWMLTWPTSTSEKQELTFIIYIHLLKSRVKGS